MPLESSTYIQLSNKSNQNNDKLTQSDQIKSISVFYLYHDITVDYNARHTITTINRTHNVIASVERKT